MAQAANLPAPTISTHVLDTVKGQSDRWAQWRELVPSMTRA